MRPIRLEMEGFGAFRLRTEVDFDDTDFFALVGPTGSGKSTVVDAICFALYGSVPRYADDRLVASAMSIGHNEARVRLTFEVGGERYVVARVVRRVRNGGATTKEARLERAGGEVLAGRASELAPAVERLLGLQFTQFLRCVVLPQGEFARFLHDRPADRQQLLVELLDLGIYDRMAKAANRCSADAATVARLAEQRLAGLAGATPEALAAARRRVSGVAAVLGELETTAPKVAGAAAAEAAARQAAEQHRAEAAALRAIAVPAQARSLGAAVAEAEAALIEATTARAAAAARAQAAAEVVKAFPPVEALRAAQQSHEMLRATRAEQEAAVAAHVAEAAKVQDAAQRRQVAQVAAVAAEAAYERARQHFAAHVVAEQLVVGEPCPACGNTVTAAPATVAAPDVQAGREQRSRAADRLERATEQVRQAEVAEARAAAAVEQAARRVAELEAAVGEHRDAARLATLASEAEAAFAAHRVAGEDEQAAARALEAARQASEAARERAASLKAGYHAQRDSVGALRPPPPSDDVVADWTALAAWAAAQAPAAEQAAAEQDRAASTAAAEHAATLDRLRDAAQAAGVGAREAPGVEDLRVAVVRAEAEARQAAELLERQVAEAEQVDAQRAAAAEESQVAGELARLLSARQFEGWLVREALDRLAAGASATLLQLSGGQFSLSVGPDREFAVVDHANGDEERPVRTLSGGETFQASLALALALADELGGLAARGAPKLDAIFLDEGFGTLDAESLEVVAATVESLGSSGRMVGIVTHVRELAARVPVRYEVRKGPATSTVERVVG